MDSKGVMTLGRTILFVLITLGIIHSALHFSLFGFGINPESRGVLSGLAVGSISTDEIISDYPSLSPLSRRILIAEWVILIIAALGTLGNFLRNHMQAKHENIEIKKEELKGRSKTDLDSLYNLLKEKKQLKISVISKIFEISEETAIEWAKIFESGNLAVINYPRMGEPELVLQKEAT